MLAVSVRRNLEAVRRRIAQACRRCGRSPEHVTLIGVTKGVAVETMQEAIACGLTDLGENRVQEARAKQQVAGSMPQAAGTGLQLGACSLQQVRWHLIGHLQRNKAKEAVAFFDVIHSVDSLPLGQALETQCASRRRTTPLEVFVQVNVSGEATKFGCRPEETQELANAVMHSTRLHLAGLMTMAPFTNDPERSRPVFRQLRELRDAMRRHLMDGPPGHRATGPHTLLLSMGMSQDFEVAIEEGTDFVRVGTAIFGTGDRGQETGDRRQGTGDAEHG